MYSKQIKKIAEYFKDKKLLTQYAGYNQIIIETNFLLENVPIRRRLWHILNNTKETPKCLECNNIVKWNRRKKKYQIFCSRQCTFSSKMLKNKKSQTMIDCWKNRNKNERDIVNRKISDGLFSFFQNQPLEKKEKRILNIKKSLGNRSEEETKETSLKRKQLWQNKSKEEKKLKIIKYRQSCLDKYGVDNPMKLKEISNKISITYQNKSEEEKETIREKLSRSIKLSLNNRSEEEKKVTKETKLKIKQAWQNKSKEEKENIVKKYKIKCINKYGIDNPMKVKEIQNKLRQRCLDKYGVENPMKVKEIQNKLRHRCLDKYGVNSYMKLKEISKKVSIEYQKKSEEEKEIIREKMRQTCLKKYNVDYSNQKHLSKLSLEKLKNPEYLKQQHHIQKKPLTEIAKELGLYGASSINIYFNKYNINILTHPTSIAEKEVISFINTSYKNSLLTNTRKVITPLELDIYLEDINLAIEFNGTYWHSDLKKPKDYHFNKVKICYEKNINLIHIYEYEWDNFKSDIKYWLKKYVNNDLENVITRDVYLKDIINKKEITLSLNWPINYDLLEKNNFKFVRTLEPEEIKIKQYSIYDAGKVTLVKA